ncbi:MAG: DUF493 domain-containing protein [Spirochaetales bacterium]|nr:DUF493 domain-containing protein [Spirochaetales bacterium]
MDMKNHEDTFPATVLTKVIMTANRSFDENREMIRGIAEGFSLNPGSWDCKMSGKGRYMSINFFADIPSRERLYELYSAIQNLEDVKYIL